MPATLPLVTAYVCSTLLKQLPYLLGSPYIPVFYNLQQSGLYKSTATFLGFLAEGIYQAMAARAMNVEKLIYSSHREQHDDAVVYASFEKWLSHIEAALGREKRTLLLAFDEFEELEEIEKAKRIDVRLLFTWMRNVIQFNPHVTLLFSGVKTLSELGTQSGLDWSDYFINVQMLRISFLRLEEARQLITKPIPDYPGEEIFPPEVVDAIITETGCHPFLIQAVCLRLITLLNEQRREQAAPGDVSLAVVKVLEDWPGYFANLWNRTDDIQRTCLRALQPVQGSTAEQLASQAQTDMKTVRRALQLLLRRDLVTLNQDKYSIAVLIFRRWLELNV